MTTQQPGDDWFLRMLQEDDEIYFDQKLNEEFEDEMKQLRRELDEKELKLKQEHNDITANKECENPSNDK